MDEKRSPFEKVNIENMSLEEKEKLSDPNYKVTGKMEGKTEQPKTFGSKSQTKDSEDKIYIIFIVPEIGEFESNFAPTPNVLVDGEFVDDIKNRLCKMNIIFKNNIKNINIAAIHTHSAPAFCKLSFENTQVEKELTEKAKEKIIETIINATNQLEEVRVLYGSCMIDGVYGNRNEKDGWSDKSVNVLRFINTSGTCIGSLLNIAVHPTILNGSNLLLSSDLLGFIRELYEKETNASCLIVNGTTGDVSTRFYRKSSGLDELDEDSQSIMNQIINKMHFESINLEDIISKEVIYHTISDYRNDDFTNDFIKSKNISYG